MCTDAAYNCYIVTLYASHYMIDIYIFISLLNDSFHYNYEYNFLGRESVNKNY